MIPHSIKKSFRLLIQGILDFYTFSPLKIIAIFSLMLAQRATAGIGLLFILPLLHTLGLETGQGNTISEFIAQCFSRINMPFQLESVLLCFIGLIMLVASIQYLLTTLSTDLKQSYTHNLRLKLYDLVLHANWSFISSRKLSEFNHVLTIQVQSVSHAAHLLLTLMAAVTTLSVMLVLAFMLSWEMTLVAILTATVFMGLLWPFYHKSFSSGATQLMSFKSIFHQLSEQLSSLKMVKSHACEHIYLKNIGQISRQLEHQNLALTRITAHTKFLYTLGAAIAFSVLLWLSQTWLNISLATLLILLIIYSRILPQVSQLQTTLQQLFHKVPAYQEVFAMRTSCRKNQEIRRGQKELCFQKQLCLKDISFQYPNAGKNVFKNLNLTLKKGEILMISGPSGVGKSTLVDIIAGLLQPSQGTLICDDQVISAEHIKAWQNNIAYVTQEVYLFHDTVRNNLLGFNSTATDNELWQALKLAAADSFVKVQPQGLDTLIGDNGIKLSGGQRQRIALARAILMKPALLILDEATSALDQDNEIKIQQAISQLQGRQTMIIISHRPHNQFTADKILHLKE